MMMQKMNNEGVSPVIGVMLMLVVTIVIAAVVSGFAGGMADEQEKVPQVQITATYSQSDGMAITHQGGDAIGTDTVTVMVRPSNTFGNAQHVVSIINKSSITNADGTAWKRAEGYSGAKSFLPGETHYILPPYHRADFLQPGVSSSYRFDSPANMGRTFWLQFADDGGRLFAKTEVLIKQ